MCNVCKSIYLDSPLVILHHVTLQCDIIAAWTFRLDIVCVNLCQLTVGVAGHLRSLRLKYLLVAR